MIILDERVINEVEVKVLFNRYLKRPYKVEIIKDGKKSTRFYKTNEGVEKFLLSL